MRKVFECLDFRCDGSPDCSDDSDEFKCDFLIIDGNYNKDIISDQNKQNIDLYVDLIISEIISIEDTQGLFRPRFEIIFQWQDYRVRFQNLNSKKINILKPFEVEQIWEPILILDDVNQFNRFVPVFLQILHFIKLTTYNFLHIRDISNEKKVSASVMKDALHVHSDNSFLHNSYIYYGNSTFLRAKMGQRLYKHIKYNIFVIF